MSAKKILITGVSGLVGSAIYLHLSQWPDRYELYGMGRRRTNSDRVLDKRKIDIESERYTIGDIADMDCAGGVAGCSILGLLLGPLTTASEQSFGFHN